MSIIVRRLNDFIKFKNLSIRKFEMEVGMSNGSLSKAIKNDTDIQTKFLENIFDKYPEINWAEVLRREFANKVKLLKKFDKEYGGL